jgi:phospholipase/carboxylesterase
VLLCGRDQQTSFMLDVVRRVGVEDVAYVVLEASGRSWYPGRLWQPLALNEPWVTWSVEACERAVWSVIDAGVPLEQVLLGGFSRGAVIATETIARAPRRYGAVAILTGALMGPDIAARAPVELPGLPVFLGASERDDWIPPDSVRSTARWFEQAGALVRLHIDDVPEHEVDDVEVGAMRDLLLHLSEVSTLGKQRGAD